MKGYFNFYKVVDKVIGTNSLYNIWGNGFYMDEIRNKAKELYNKLKEKNEEFDGILIRVIRENVHGQMVNCYYLYWDGKRFRKDPDDLVEDYEAIRRFLYPEYKNE
jgi:hypothetical protein